MTSLDTAAVERAAQGVCLRLPRSPHRGKVGEVRASSVGSSMELHDFRHYHPGDDLRHVDWNAVARTGELIIRVRQDEVSPRVEVVLDGSASMAVSPEKAARARELALWVCLTASRGGLEPVLITTGVRCEKLPLHQARIALPIFAFDGRDTLDVALRRAPPLRPCGLRVVVSDFLFEAVPGPLVDRLSRGATGLSLVQVLDAEDADPTGGAGARLTDAETGEVMERLLAPGVVKEYLQRLAAHVELWRGASRRVRATWTEVVATSPIDALVRRELSALVEAGA